MGNYIIEIDFYSDWVNILRSELNSSGYNVSSDEKPEEDSLKYFNLKKRLIVSNPIAVKIAKEIFCPNELKAGLEILKQKIEKSEDLRLNLSIKIINIDYDAPLLNRLGDLSFSYFLLFYSKKVMDLFCLGCNPTDTLFVVLYRWPFPQKLGHSQLKFFL